MKHHRTPQPSSADCEEKTIPPYAQQLIPSVTVRSHVHNSAGKHKKDHQAEIRAPLRIQTLVVPLEAET